MKEIQHKAFRFIILSVILSVSAFITVYSQVDSIINEYAHVLKIYNSDPTDPDSVKVNHPEVFNDGDTVLFIVTKGASVDGSGMIADWGNMGRYNVLLVYRKVQGNILIFSTRLRYLHPPMAGEIIQLIRVRGGRDIYRVDEPLTCKAWDPSDSTGGVFALVAGRKIVLNATIDVSGKGFRGGDPEYPSTDRFTGICTSALGFFYLESEFNNAGRAGESVVYEGYPYTRGRGSAAARGGGGNGKYSGGGGGGNFGQGGRGGRESENCNPGSTNLGGTFSDIQFYYKNSDVEYENRIFLGSGGGTGSQNPDSSRSATKGGKGGGIVILISDTIEAIGSQQIIASGEDVTSVATAGAGGGGAGGVIILESAGYIGNITMDVSGGNGGWTNHSDFTGPGGGGGGGVVWHSNNTLPAGITLNVASGTAGRHNIAGSRGATTGIAGSRIPDLRIPLSGFLFNVMPGDQDICEGDVPHPFMASTPKGGDGPGTYTYKWLRSMDKISWNDAPIPNNGKDYYSDPLTDTSFFKRIVFSGATIDTSLLLTINVLPHLINNNIAADDTLCQGSVIPEIKDDPFFNTSGGDGTYAFLWEASTDLSGWDTIKATEITFYTDTILRYQTPMLTTYYRRIIHSHVCSLLSDTVTITVLDSISDNSIFSGDLIFPQDTICENDNAQIINGLLPGGGDGSYRYTWQSSFDTVVWNPTIPSNGQNFDPGILTDTIFYRRLVISGSGNVCRDTSNIVTVLVHPLIVNNIISGDTIICMDDPALQIAQLSGNTGGGDGFYHYLWQSRSQSGTWQPAGNTDTLSAYEPGYIEDTTSYRRYIISGACEDFSNEVTVLVQDSIMNNLITGHDTICENAIPAPITGTFPTGGDIRYTPPAYQWESRLNSTAWATVSGANLSGYSPPALSDTTYYRRKVNSGKCSHLSDPVEIIVQAPIYNNLILNGTEDETCYETTIDLDGTTGISEMTGGDKVNYSFAWQISPDGLAWITVPEADDLEDFTTAELVSPAYFRRMVTSGACSDISPSTHISINPRPTAVVPDNYYSTECYDSKIGPVGISIPFVLTGTPPFTIISFDGMEYDTIENILTQTGNFTDYLVTGNIDTFNIEIVFLTDGNGCEAYPDSLIGTVTMEVYKMPEINILDDEYLEVCGEIVQLDATQDVGNGYWMYDSGEGTLTFNNPSLLSVQASTQHDSDDSKWFKVFRKGKNWPVSQEEICTIADSIEVVFWKIPEPAYAGIPDKEGPDTTIYFADYMYMFADQPTAGNGSWTLTSGTADIENNSLYNTRVDLGDQDLEEPVEYTFNWTVSNGTCPETSDDLVVARRDLRIYEGFSPDGNSINEYFTIGGLEYADTWDLKIFSKSGNLIRRVSGQLGDAGGGVDQLWDGTYDGGRPVESGVYYYVLEVTKANQTYQYKGSIVMARERL